PWVARAGHRRIRASHSAFCIRSRSQAVAGLSRVEESPELGKLVDNPVERLSDDELHGIEREITFPADLEDRHDVRVVQPGGSPGLGMKPLQRLVVAEHVAGKHLQGYAPSQ